MEFQIEICSCVGIVFYVFLIHTSNSVLPVKGKNVMEQCGYLNALFHSVSVYSEVSLDWVG